MYTQRHFESVAATLRDLRADDESPSDPVWMWQRTVNELADLFARHNPRFKRERFIRACGGES